MALRALAFFALGFGLLAAPQLKAQVFINEIVEDEQDFETTDITPDTREFVELYNAGATSVDISGWTLGSIVIDTAAATIDTLPPGSMIPAGGYFVIGASGVPFVNYTPVSGELWNNTKTIYELRNPNLPEPMRLVDAVALETFRTSETDLLTQEQIDQTGAGQTAGVGARAGWWGQIESLNAHPSNANFPNLPQSLGRYLDGRDRNINGYDFGMIPATPGASNNRPQVPAHIVPDVTAVAVGSVLKNDYYASFKAPYVINPGQTGPAGLGGQNINPNIIPESPQGGRAIMAWDETGGGNAVYSKSYVNKFEISAFIDPRAFNNTTTDSTYSEATVYGIGSTDPLFGTPNSADLLTGHPSATNLPGNITSSSNGSTGLGWLIQRRTANAAGVQTSAAVLQLLDMNDGGDGVIADNDWQIKASYDLTGMAQDWHTLSIDYNPATGAVTAKFGDQTTNFTTATGLVGNFYAGYRENLPGAGIASMRPPTWDLVEAAEDDADFDGDSDVDGADFLTWQRGVGNPGDLADGDANGDNVVNGLDLVIWRDQFGPAAVAAVGAVPEPAALVLGVFGLAALAVGRKRIA